MFSLRTLKAGANHVMPFQYDTRRHDVAHWKQLPSIVESCKPSYSELEECICDGIQGMEFVVFVQRDSLRNWLLVVLHPAHHFTVVPTSTTKHIHSISISGSHILIINLHRNHPKNYGRKCFPQSASSQLLPLPSSTPAPSLSVNNVRHPQIALKA